MTTNTIGLEAVDVAIVGAGAAGLAVAAFLGRRAPRLRVVLFEGARKPGAKILVSGGSRCNVTKQRPLVHPKVDSESHHIGIALSKSY